MTGQTVLIGGLGGWWSRSMLWHGKEYPDLWEMLKQLIKYIKSSYKCGTVQWSTGHLSMKKYATVFSICGESLSHDLTTFTANVSSKRDEYFAKALNIN